MAAYRNEEQHKADLEASLKEANVRIEAIKFRTLPDLMDEVGVSTIILDPEGNNPGVVAKAEPFYRASIAASWPPEKRADAFACLKEEGAEDLIKTEVVVSFPRGENESAEEFANRARAAGLSVVIKEDVPWATLTSWLKESVEKHNHTPDLERLGATVGRIVKLKPLKDK